MAATTKPSKGRPPKKGDARLAWRWCFPEELRDVLTQLGLKPYRAAQLFQWLHQHGIQTFDEATNLSQADRAQLAAAATLTNLTCLEEQRSQVDGTVKYLFGLPEGGAVESVLIPAKDRNTLCVSSQVGCAYACSFCATGRMGYTRSLWADEIIGQYYEVRRRGYDITNIVFMGMGEPLANYDELLRAIRLMAHPEGANLGIRRFTVSTVGLVPEIRRLGEENLQINLAISLNATTNALRNRLMPVNRKYPIETLLSHARAYAVLTHRRVSFEYVLLAGVNDGVEDAKRLAKRLSGWLNHVNLIPYNSVAGLPFHRPDPMQVEAFKEILVEAGVPVSVRESGGPDIQAACGQLRTSVSSSRIT